MYLGARSIIEERRSKTVHVLKWNHKTVTPNFSEMEKKINILNVLLHVYFSVDYSFVSLQRNESFFFLIAKSYELVTYHYLNVYSSNIQE